MSVSWPASHLAEGCCHGLGVGPHKAVIVEPVASSSSSKWLPPNETEIITQRQEVESYYIAQLSCKMLTNMLAWDGPSYATPGMQRCLLEATHCQQHMFANRLLIADADLLAYTVLREGQGCTLQKRSAHANSCPCLRGQGEGGDTNPQRLGSCIYYVSAKSSTIVTESSDLSDADL